MKKIIINKKNYGNIELAPGKNAYNIFVNVIRAFKANENFSVKLLYSDKKIQSFKNYQSGGCSKEVAELEMYMQMCELFNKNSEDAKALKQEIEFVNDNAYVNLNISKRLHLSNKKQPSNTKGAYLFWDIENFSNISPMFFHIIEPFEIEDEHIYVACNPDSLYLFKAEWEADLYDFSKTLNSFNFTKCDHGKNVADGVLLDYFKDLKPKNSDIYIITYDRELKELFKDACHPSNNLYILDRKILN
ncbi:hypothetical protein JHD50_13130 [Sulfurimonas sp. MAG313]|nr:hypothetical protein [Sulfurimonas sp. MAG313]MDF1882231.1 hypothetical protein [Sulfurimonas sp. MAG313]